MGMDDKKLYTLLVYSENIAGILNQITAVFTRRQVNIESLNVSASSIPGVHKYTITAWHNDEQEIIKITKQIEKKIDVVKANYYTDEQLSSARWVCINFPLPLSWRIQRSQGLSDRRMPR